MSHINLREEKERDFLLAYEEELKELGEDAPFVPRDEIIIRTLHSGRGRFYVSFEEAARQVKRIYNRRPLKCRNQRKVAMYQELARLVAEYRMRKPGASFRDALFTVLAEAKASRFFFGVQTGRLILYRRPIKGDICLDSLCHCDMSVDQLTIDLVASCDHIITIFCNIDLDDFYRHFLAIVIHKRFIRYKRRIRQIVGNGIFRRYRKCFHFVQCRLSFRIRIGIRYKWNACKHRRRQCCNADDFFCLSANLSVVKIILSSHNFPPSLISIHFRLLMFCS